MALSTAPTPGSNDGDGNRGQLRQSEHLSDSIQQWLISLHLVQVLNLCVHQIPWGGGGGRWLTKMQIAGPHLRVSDSVGLGWESNHWVANKLPSDVDDTGPGTTL